MYFNTCTPYYAIVGAHRALVGVTRCLSNESDGARSPSHKRPSPLRTPPSTLTWDFSPSVAASLPARLGQAESSPNLACLFPREPTACNVCAALSVAMLLSSSATASWVVTRAGRSSGAPRPPVLSLSRRETSPLCLFLSTSGCCTAVKNVPPMLRPGEPPRSPATADGRPVL